MRKLKKITFILLCAAIALSLNVSAFAHGVFLDVSNMHGTVGQEITVQVGWGYIFLGHDGSAITGPAPVRRVFLINPNGTEIPLTYAIFHQYLGRDYPENPINQITVAQVGTDEFPTGGRHLTYIEVAFTPQSSGYYQVVFHRDRNVPTTGGNEGRQITDIAKAFILVGGAAPTAAAGHGRLTAINRTEIRPASDVGRLTAGSDFVGYALYGGQPLVDHDVRFEIAAHEYIIATTNEQGRFTIALPPAAVGNFAIRIQRDTDVSGTLHGQDFTSVRDIHILQVAVFADAQGVAVTVPAVVGPVLPPLFASGTIIMVIVGGLLLLAAGFFFGLGFGAIKAR
jgi:hypothetical protein